jgi:glycosyltransferase involved in cell wall biosynthesis
MQRALEGLIQMPVAYLPHPVEFHAETRRRGGEKSPEGLTTEDTVASQAGAAFSNPSTSELSRDCENISRTRSATAPASLPATSYALPATSAKPIVFGCYGAARWEKGSDIFREAIKLILKNQAASDGCRVASIQSEGTWELGPAFLPITSNPLPATPVGRPLCFVIQWVEDFRDGQGNLVSIDPWLKNHPQVEVIGRYFKGDQYDEQLERTDVMVLPYRSPYRLRVSRVVIEAMMNGMPVIATRGTTLFDQADEYGVVVGCGEGSAESLAEAILEIAEGFEKMRASAKKFSEKAAESFSVAYFREFLARNG